MCQRGELYTHIQTRSVSYDAQNPIGGNTHPSMQHPDKLNPEGSYDDLLIPPNKFPPEVQVLIAIQPVFPNFMATPVHHLISRSCLSQSC